MFEINYIQLFPQQEVSVHVIVGVGYP